jgi:P-type Cu+ transporter
LTEDAASTYEAEPVCGDAPLTGAPEPACGDACDSEARRHAGPPVAGWAVLSAVAAVIAAAAVGERVGVFDAALERLPWWLLAGALLVGGWPVLRGVATAARKRRVTAHTLMSLGVLAAVAIGEWPTAVLIVFFMRLASWIEARTNDRSRQAIQQLAELAPSVARVVRDGREVDVPVELVRVGEVVVVRPGERIPVDGEVVDGHAPVDESSITGESVPADKTIGDRVYAATVAQAGALKVRTTRVGDDTTFGRILHLVEEAAGRRAPVQRFADRFSAYYIPVVLSIAAVTLLVTGQVLNAVAVVVVACACAIVIATPVAVMASVGSAARRGLIIKGGATLERLAQVDTVVVDKTGTLTHGRPRLTDIVALGWPGDELLAAVAAAEQRSEHPLARAIVAAAEERGVAHPAADAFTAVPGRGATAVVAGRSWLVGNRALLAANGVTPDRAAEMATASLEDEGKTVFFAATGGRVVGLVALADTVRADAAGGLAALRALGVEQVVMLTGDNARAAAAVAAPLGLDYRAGLLPEDKTARIRALQAAGRVVLMVGDGINDAPALAAADVGVAMGVAGTDAALDAGDIALLREDWQLVADALLVGRRGARTIRQNLVFAAAYNVLGIAAAAVGLLPPVWAAAAQSLPDGFVLANSARLLRPPIRKQPVTALPRLASPSRQQAA